MKFSSLNKKTGLAFVAALAMLSTVGCGGRSENVTPVAVAVTAPVAAANSASRIPEGVLKGMGLEEVWYLGKVVSGNEEVGLQLSLIHI